MWVTGLITQVEEWNCMRRFNELRGCKVIEVTM